MENLRNKELNNNEIYDENNGLYYTKVGDYYYPNIVINDEEKITLGKYGRARLQYLKSHKRGLWSELIMTEELTKHLKDVDDNATNKVKNIINNLAKKDNFPIYYDGIIDQLEWVKTMNNYKNIAEELVYNELIYC